MVGKIAKMVLRPSGATVIGVLGAAALACYIAEHRDTLIEVVTNVKINISDKIEVIKNELNDVKKCTVASATNSGINEPTEVSSDGKVDKETGVASEVGTPDVDTDVDTEISKFISDSEKAIAKNVLHHLDTAVSLCKGVMSVLHKNYGIGVFTDSESSTVDTTGDSADNDMADDSTVVDNSMQQEVPTENEVDDNE